MGMYCIGDIQGCASTLDNLLDAIGFSPSRDTLHVLGDMVNRGPASAAVLRRLMRLEGSAFCILGNHDIHLLAVSLGLRQMGRKDTLTELLCAPDASQLLEWLRHQPLAMQARDCLMVHAGVQPAWDVATTLACAEEVSSELRGKAWKQFLSEVFGNSPDRWDAQLQGMDRWRVIINTLTRIRYIDSDGRMDFAYKRGLQDTPAHLIPWFAHPLRRTAHQLVAFGHWSALGLITRPNLLALDTGCVWGGQLTAVQLHAKGRYGRIVQVQSLTHAAP